MSDTSRLQQARQNLVQPGHDASPSQHVHRSAHAEPPSAPAYLSDDTKAFWAAIVSTWSLEVHHLELLGAACECLDKIEAARRIVAQEGIVIRDRFDKPQEHPAGKLIRNEKTLLAKLLRELSLDSQRPEEYSRPPLIPGRYESRR
jgi:phage terminase small subunit